MAKPLTVSISHQLGKQEAIRRLTDGLGYIQSRFGDKVAVTENRWVGDQLNFTVAALKQTASGIVDVAEDHVTLTVTLPFLLAMMAEKAKALIQKEGTLLLEKK